MTDPDIRWKERFDNFQRALRQLTAAVGLSRVRPLSDLERQGLIQGFEFTHELAWNVLEDYSRSTVREAFKHGLIEVGEVWMDMIDKRSLSSHTYNEAIALAVAQAVVERYHSVFLNLGRRLSELT
ncbi:nucleotidyltransferase substrate binding protein [Thermosynechococcus sp. HY213]|uniref:nucleotidyltransferase substrate binding protein n=1 Tax=Thermosynechococcus sp. HY213 TaxID=3074104 RepID=UPI002855EDE6|nr:nucleotidyltransferase substrate binding protein [Thermosynechococcus sp. HY213]MDR7921520.1 nucleotidyltransferase substrate binding protein [Thermosynechococcus sp. HY213]